MEPGYLRDPWLVAAWPGMGAVALGAGQFLRRALRAREIAEIPPGDYFDVSQVAVKGALVRTSGLPRSTLYGWRNPLEGGRDLLLFLGEAQPTHRGFAFCRDLVDRAVRYGVRRVFTFAAMATPSHPKSRPRVVGVANQPDLLEELRELDVELLTEGEISGLNGVLLAAATERGLGGICLLGEFPYFASSIPNPKASAAVLRVFASLALLDLDLGPMDAQAEETERRLLALLARLQQAAQAPATEEGADADPDLPFPPPPPEPSERDLSTLDKRRIEQLFREATKDRTKALKLKAELDRLGVFRAYEDRFLDLFKRGE